MVGVWPPKAMADEDFGVELAGLLDRRKGKERVS